jgi:hypothetical protein
MGRSLDTWKPSKYLFINHDNLCREGRSQVHPGTHRLLASSPAEIGIQQSPKFPQLLVLFTAIHNYNMTYVEQYVAYELRKIVLSSGI